MFASGIILCIWCVEVERTSSHESEVMSRANCQILVEQEMDSRFPTMKY